jgi:phage minor structural protein
MICYYNKNETSFSHNGLGILDDNIISPVVTEELNGVFKLEFDYPTHATHGDGMTPERIVRCPVPDMQDQLFRIVEREASISGTFHIVAYHVFYDLLQNLIEDTFITYKNGAQALAQLLGATQFSHGFTSSSNIATVSSARMVRLNAATAILDGGTDNSYKSRWGGEIIRDRFLISMQTVRGSDNGVQIRDKKNLTGYRADVDYGSAVTRIMPMGYDGLMLPEKYVDSPRIGDYQTPRIRVIKYDKVKALKDGDTNPPEDAVPLAEAYAMLRTLAAQEYSVNKADLPACSYAIEFAPLERTEEYKQFAALETVNMGDVVSVVHEEDGLDISARMVSYKYDPLMQAYISIELGTASPKFTNAVSEMKSAAVSAVISAVESGSVVLPQAGNDRASTYYGANEPSNPREADLWYRDNGDKLELWIYETRDGVTQWWPLISDLTNEELRQSLEQAKSESADAVTKANQAYDEAVAALGTTTALTGRVSAAEATLTVHEGLISAKASQTAVDTLTGRITTAETAITQNAESFSLSLSKTTKVVNGLAGASILQTAWQQGTLSTSTGAESSSAAYVRSGYIDVVAGRKYLLQTYEGASSYSTYGTAYLFYYREDKTFLSYTTNGSTTTPFTIPADAAYLRVRLTTATAPASVNCYLLQTDTTNGFTDLSTMTSMLKLQATSDTLMVTVGETKAAIGTPFVVKAWERGTLSTSTGAESASTSYLRSGFIDVTPGERYIGQTRDGTALTVYFHFYGFNALYVDYVPVAKQYTETLAAGAYDNATIADYLASLDAESMGITGAVASGYTYNTTGDHLVIVRIPLDGRAAPSVIRWRGFRDTSDNIVLLYTGSAWEQIGTLTAPEGAADHDWMLTDAQRSGISANVHIAFYAKKNGSYAGINHASATPFTLNPMTDSLFTQVSYTGTSSYAIVPANAVKMRVRVATTTLPDEYTGNIYPGTTRADYSKGDTLYSALLMQKDLINLRVAKNDVVNQINVSTEGILISGSKVHITGQTTIDSAVIQSAMIANLAVTNAKIADATIQSAKIATIDAAKITTGTLAAARIGANSITADKVSTNFLEALTGSSAIRITGTTISYYSGSSLTSQINSNGFELTRDSVKIGRIGTNSFQQNSAWRGLVFDLEYSGNYMSWSWKESSSASVYTTKFTYYRSKLADGMEKGFHFDDVVFLKSGIAAASGSSVVTNNISYWTFSSTAYLNRTTVNSKAGIALGGSSLLLGSQGTWVDANTLRAICALLAGKTVYLPASSSGLSSWWSVSFPSMTTWST